MKSHTVIAIFIFVASLNLTWLAWSLWDASLDEEEEAALFESVEAPGED